MSRRPSASTASTGGPTLMSSAAFSFTETVAGVVAGKVGGSLIGMPLVVPVPTDDQMSGEPVLHDAARRDRYRAS